MKQIKGFNGYYVQGLQVIGRHKHPLKPDKRNIIAMCANDGKLYRGELYKIIWSALNDIDVRDVPKLYSFREENGTIIVETFSERMSNVRKQYYNTAKAKYDDYVFIADYAEIAKQMLNHYPDSRLRLFHLLNSKRDECVKYARYASGGVSQEKAETYTDQAIIKVFETICKGLYAVPSPIASIKWHVNHAIRLGRRKRELNYKI